MLIALNGCACACDANLKISTSFLSRLESPHSRSARCTYFHTTREWPFRSQFASPSCVGIIMCSNPSNNLCSAHALCTHADERAYLFFFLLSIIVMAITFTIPWLARVATESIGIHLPAIMFQTVYMLAVCRMHIVSILYFILIVHYVLLLPLFRGTTFELYLHSVCKLRIAHHGMSMERYECGECACKRRA